MKFLKIKKKNYLKKKIINKLLIKIFFYLINK